MKLIEEHYRDNRERLTRVAQSKGMPLFLAEEIVQETYTNVLENIPTYDEEKSFDKWLNQIFNNCLKQSFKQERHRGMTHVPKDVIEIYEDIIEAFKEENDR